MKDGTIRFKNFLPRYIYIFQYICIYIEAIDLIIKFIEKEGELGICSVGLMEINGTYLKNGYIGIIILI